MTLIVTNTWNTQYIDTYTCPYIIIIVARMRSLMLHFKWVPRFGAQDNHSQMSS